MKTDRSDILECQQGNLQAFERLVRCYQQHAIGVAYQMLGDWEDARDAAQDAFIKAYQAINSFDVSRCKFSTWLYRILINTCIDYHRRRDAVTEAIGITPFSGFYQEPPAPDHDIEASEHRAILKQALDRLSDRHRAVVTLRDLQGLSCREIGEIMACSEATVRVHLFHARRKLKKILRPLIEHFD